MPYIYQGDIYCDNCGEEIKRDISLVEDMDDSNSYPQECLISELEADTPQHCGCNGDCINAIILNDVEAVGKFLKNSLTDYGIKYVKEMWILFTKAKDKSCYNEEILRLWMDYYDIWYFLRQEETESD